MSSDSENDTQGNHLSHPSEQNGGQNGNQPASSEYRGASFAPDEAVADNATIHARFEQDPEGYANERFLPDLVQRVQRDQEYRRRFSGTDTGVSGGAAGDEGPFPDPLSHSVITLLREVYARHLREVFARHFTKEFFRSQNPYVVRIARYIRHFEEQGIFEGKNGWRQFDHYIRREVLTPFLSGKPLPGTAESYQQALLKETETPEAEKSLAGSERNDKLPAANISSFTSDMGQGESETPAPPAPTDRKVDQQTENQQLQEENTELRAENTGLRAQLQEFRHKTEEYLSRDEQQQAVIAELRQQIQALQLQLHRRETETGAPVPSESERIRPAAPEAVPEPSGAFEDRTEAMGTAEADEEIQAGEATGIDADVLTECPPGLRNAFPGASEKNPLDYLEENFGEYLTYYGAPRDRVFQYLLRKWDKTFLKALENKVNYIRRTRGKDAIPPVNEIVKPGKCEADQILDERGTSPEEIRAVERITARETQKKKRERAKQAI